MNKKINITLAALLALGAITASAQTVGTTATNTVACQEDAKVCPNGTTVGRTGPHCEFVCPGGPANTGTTPRPLNGVRNDIKEARDANKEMRKDIRATSTALREGLRDERKDLHASTTERMREASTTMERRDIRNEARNKQIEIIKQQAILATQRIEAAIMRLDTFVGRVSAALDKASTQGIDVSASRAELSLATADLAKARTQVNAIKATTIAPAPTATTSAATLTPKAQLENFKGAIKAVTETLQSAQGHVAKSISLLKPGLNKPRPAATSTTGTATSTH